MVSRFMVAVAAPAIVAVLLAGCGSSKSTTNPTPNASAALGTAGPQGNLVLVEGEDQGPIEHVRCDPYNGGVYIKIGMGAHGVEIGTDPPAVQTVHFSDILIGGVEADMGLDFEAGQNEGAAEATKQGNTYKITGTAMSSNASKPGSKSFEIDVTCPS